MKVLKLLFKVLLFSIALIYDDERDRFYSITFGSIITSLFLKSELSIAIEGEGMMSMTN